MSVVPDPPEKVLSNQAHMRRERERAIGDQTWKKKFLNSLSRYDMTDFSLLNGVSAASLKPDGNSLARLAIANKLRQEGLAKVAAWDAQGGMTCLKRALATVQALLREGLDDTVEVGVRIKDYAPKERLLSQKKLPMKARELQLRIECDIIGARLRSLGPKRLGDTVPVDPFSMSMPVSNIPGYTHAHSSQLLSSANLAPPTPLMTGRGQRSQTPLPQKPPTALAQQQARSRTPSPWMSLSRHPNVPALHISRRGTPMMGVEAPSSRGGAWGDQSAAMDELAVTNMRLMEENRALRDALESSQKRNSRPPTGESEMFVMGNDYKWTRPQGY